MRNRLGIRRGSMTIETALLMPLLLFVIMGLLYLFFWVHNRAWLTVAAYESAVSGCIEGICENGNAYEAADEKSRELGSAGFFGTRNLQAQTFAGKTVKVVYTSDIVSTGGSFSWSLQAVGEAEIIRPVSWIRKTRAVKETIREIGGGT